MTSERREQRAPAPGETFKQLSGETAKRTADLVSRYNDLQLVRDALERLVALQKSTSDDVVLMQCLWTTALVYYGRCFGKGKLRTITSGLSDGLISGHELMHQSIIDRRDEQAAHAIEAAYDDVVIAAGFVPDASGVPRFNSLAVRNVRNLAAGTENVEVVYRHVLAVIERLARVIIEHERQLHAEVAAAAASGDTAGLVGHDVTAEFGAERGVDQAGPLGGSVSFRRPEGPSVT